jgi:hypothetical protein
VVESRPFDWNNPYLYGYVGDPERSIIVTANVVEVTSDPASFNYFRDNNQYGDPEQPREPVFYDYIYNPATNSYGMTITEPDYAWVAVQTKSVVPEPPVISFTSMDAKEGAPGSPGGITVKLNKASTAPITLNYELIAAANAGEDLLLVPGDFSNRTVTIEAGKTEATVTWVPKNDKLYEPKEEVIVRFEKPANASFTEGGASAEKRFFVIDDEVSQPGAGILPSEFGYINETRQVLLETLVKGKNSPDYLKDPLNVGAVNGAIKLLGEALQKAGVTLDLLGFANDYWNSHDRGDANASKDLYVDLCDFAVKGAFAYGAGSVGTLVAIAVIGAPGVLTAVAGGVVTIGATWAYDKWFQDTIRVKASADYDGKNTPVQVPLGGSQNGDIIVADLPNNRAIDGGEGLDTVVYHGTRTMFSIADVAEGSAKVSGPGGSDTVVNVEHLQFVDGFLTTNPNEAAGQIFRIYGVMLGREPDLGGLAGWHSAMGKGVTLTNIVEGFTGSTEFQTKYGSTTNEQFVQLLYRNALGREGEPSGVEGWVQALNSGTSRSDVALGFSESEENISKTTSEIHKGLWVGDTQAAIVARMYDTTLDRLPDLNGLTGWSSALRAGLTREQLAEGFTNSTEYQQRYGSLDSAGFVDLLYRNVLDRAPDPEGLANWTAALNGDVMSRAAVALGFSESQEHIAKLSPQIDSGVWIV